jgi:coniferyl-aldehyde dehydrogenase
MNAGQTCVAPDYALVPRRRRDDFVAALRAATTRQYPSVQANPDYTSIASERHYRRLQALVDDARTRGARVIDLGPEGEAADPAARQLPPTVLLDVDDGMRVMQEEIFGPILPILTYDTLDEAIAYINRRDRPLSLYWFGADRGHRDKVLARTLSGGVVVNDTMLHVAQDALPFGGVGASGHGHYHGEFGFRQFSKEKPVFIQSRFSGGRRMYPPYTGATRRLLRLLFRWA